MATPKKTTNYISYEIVRLEKYVSQLNGYLDSNPPDQLTDRIEILQSTRGNPIIKVIASKEQQLKAFSDILQKLPKLLEDLNSLRKTVNDETPDVAVRGNQSKPGFMQIAENPIKSGEYEEENTNTNEEFREEDFDEPKSVVTPTQEEDDDDFVMKEEPTQKLLNSSSPLYDLLDDEDEDDWREDDDE